MRVRVPDLRLPAFGVPRIDPPRRELRVRMGGRRVIGVAEYGDPDGRLVLWFHGTPGGRRQIPAAARRAATTLGLRLACVERPGVGESTGHRHTQIVDWADDAAAVADHLGHGQFAVAGLSGGGPYALATAARLPDRVTAVGVLGGVCPVAGPDAGPDPRLIGLAVRFQPILDAIRVPLGLALWGVLQPTAPLSHHLYGLFGRVMPEGDRTVLANPEIEAMFIDDIRHGSRRRFGAIAHDIALFGRDWGFALADVRAPVRWWHGDADPLVSLDQARHAVARLPDATLIVRHGESHLGGFAAADDVLVALDGMW